MNETQRPQGQPREETGKPSLFCCHEIGMTMEGTKTRQLEDGTWEATSKIGSIFGAEAEGELKGSGATEDEAIKALAKERHDLHESLWI